MGEGLSADGSRLKTRRLTTKDSKTTTTYMLSISQRALGLGLFTAFLAACQPETGPATAVEPTLPALPPVPLFNGDSAYAFVAKQVAFGPRVPGSAAHRACGDWMVAKLKSYGATVVEQNAMVTIYNGQQVPMRNIIASWQPERKERILLFTHWDSRPFADQDSVRRNEPIDPLGRHLWSEPHRVRWERGAETLPKRRRGTMLRAASREPRAASRDVALRRWSRPRAATCNPRWTATMEQ